MVAVSVSQKCQILSLNFELLFCTFMADLLQNIMTINFVAWGTFGIFFVMPYYTYYVTNIKNKLQKFRVTLDVHVSSV